MKNKIISKILNYALLIATILLLIKACYDARRDNNPEKIEIHPSEFR